MTKSRIFLYFCLSFIAGIFVNSLIFISQLLMSGFLILGILLISVFWRDKRFVVAGFCILFLVAGIYRHQTVSLSRTVLNSEQNDKETTVVLEGVVAGEPNFGKNTAKLIIKIENLDGENVDGKILLTTYRYPEYQYGDKLKIFGKLKTPSEDIGGFNCKNYLEKEGIYSVMDWPKIEVSGQGFGNPIMKILFSFKNKLEEGAEKIMSPPQLGFLEALLFGNEENFSKEWKNKLNITGVRHITAVSGMNITIIANILMGFLISIGLWRGQAFYFTIIILILYIFMIGAPASAIRAGIMGGILLLAQHLGRLNSASRAIVFASVFMLAINPLLLRFDVGFQLSFLAVMGMIYLGPYFYEKFKRIPEAFGIRLALTSTISAQIFTLPILIYNFGRISLVSIPMNILIVPWLPLLTVYGFLIIVLGVLWLPLGQILSWPAWLILTFFTKMIDFVSGFRLAALTLKNVPWIFPIIFYLILGYLIFKPIFKKLIICQKST